MTLSQAVSCWKLAGGRFTPATANVINESELPVYINGKRLFTASITPTLEKEFVAGYLFGQGLVNRIEEIASLEIRDGGAQVALTGHEESIDPAEPSFRIVSGGGKTAYFGEAGLPEIKSDLTLSKDDIFRAMNMLFEKAALYRKTEGVHAAALFTPRLSPLCVVEDIGRHNTLDKVIGFALLNRVDCANVFLVSTGRMASEMVIKICRAGIPLVATKTAVTDKGLEIGKRCGMTVIGFVKNLGTQTHTDMEVRVSQKALMKIYCGAQRVVE